MFDNAVKPHPVTNGVQLDGKPLYVFNLEMTEFIDFPFKPQEIQRWLPLSTLVSQSVNMAFNFKF